MKITSLQNERIKQWVLLKEKRGRDLAQHFLIEGEHLLEMALKAGVVETILFDDEYPVREEGIELIEVTRPIIEKLATTKTPTHCIAICRFLKDFMGETQNLVALDGVQDPGNGGVIVRSALAFDFDHILLSQNCFDQYNDKFIRATMGAIFAVPLQRVDLPATLKDYKANGYDIIVADLNHQAIRLPEYVPSEKTILVLGSEGQGISKEIAALATSTVFIPMNPQLDSLNVGVAAGILMYHINQRRGPHGK